MLTGSIQLRSEVGRRPSCPDDAEVGAGVSAVDGDQHFLDETAEQLLALAVVR
jgi:hypothetical protein